MTFAGSTAATCASSNSSGRLRLLALLFAFVLLASLFNATVPLGEGPDEPGHLSYVLFLAREGRLPVQRTPHEQSDVPGEGHQPPLAYGLALPAVLWLPPNERHNEQSANPDFLWNGGDDPAAFVRASREYWPWQGVVLAWHLVRGISTLLGVVTVFCTWGAARSLAGWSRASQQPDLALLAAALVAFNPQFLFTSALVTNDALLTTLSAVLLWLCTSRVLHPNFPPLSPALPSPTPVSGRSLRPLLWHAAAAGVVTGLALLTKQSALLLIPLALWGSWQAGQGRARLALFHGLCWMTTALLVAGWWYGRNWQLYGDPLGMAVFRAAFATQPFEWRNPAAWVGALRQLHASFWATFGWLSVPPPPWSIAASTLLEGVSLVGLLRLVRRSRARILPSRFFPLILLPLLAFAWVVSFALTAGLVAWQGRLLFPALPAIAILLAWGITTVLPHQALIRWGLPTVLCLLALALPFHTIAPAYSWYTLPPEQAKTRIASPVYARYAQAWEQGIELRGWRMHPLEGTMGPDRTVRAGQTLTVTLTWHALERVPDDLVVFVHLVRADAAGEGNETIIAEHNGRPHLEQFPTFLWTVGDWLEDAHPLGLPAGLPPGRYLVRVGLWHWPHCGKRQPAWDRDGSSLGTSLDMGPVIVGDE
ncbi:MAG: hypothetical protein HC884_16505 [Chloroflexaceae bacterium]|nr:hypothetical protein [Chloroflexaceae bacterium]